MLGWAFRKRWKLALFCAGFVFLTLIQLVSSLPSDQSSEVAVEIGFSSARSLAVTFTAAFGAFSGLLGIVGFFSTPPATAGDVTREVVRDGDQTRQILEQNQAALGKLSAALLDGKLPPSDAIDHLYHAVEHGQLARGDRERFVNLYFQVVLDGAAPQGPANEAIQAQLDSPYLADLLSDTLANLEGRPRSELIDERESAIALSGRDLSKQYAQLAAFAAIDSPKRAIDLYEKALKFDPKSGAAAVAFGQLLLHNGNLKRAIEVLQQSLSQPHDTAEKIDLSIALALALRKRGHLAESGGILAKAADQAGVELPSHLNDPRWLHRGAVLFLETGRYWFSVANNSKAIEQIDRSLAFGEKLHNIGHYCAKCEDDHASAIALRALLADRLGEPDKALRYHEEAVKVYDELLRQYPKSELYKKQVVAASTNMAIALVQRGLCDKATILFDRAREINSELREQFPDNKEYERDLLVLDLEQVRALTNSSKFSEAAELADDGIARLQLRADDDEHNLETKRDLAQMFQRRGQIEMRLGAPSTALSFFEESRAIHEQLLAKTPNNSNAKFELALGSLKVAAAKVNSGYPSIALALLDEAMSLILAVEESEPGQPEARFARYEVLNCMGDAFWNSGLRGKAFEAWSEAQAAIEELSCELPQIPLYKSALTLMTDKIVRFRDLTPPTKTSISVRMDWDHTDV